jgi:hypothetical protein
VGWRPTTYGGLPGKSTTLGILTVNNLIHRLNSFKTQYYIYFGDATKAFDLLLQRKVVSSLETRIQDPILREELQNRMRECHYTTLMGDSSITVTITKGVAQGDPLGPFYFIMTYEEMQRQDDLHTHPPQEFAFLTPPWLLEQFPRHDLDPVVFLHKHIYIDDNTQLDTFSSTKSIVKGINKIVKRKKKWGIQDNTGKAQVMVHPVQEKMCAKFSHSSTKLPYGNEHIHVSSSAKYLGTYVSMSGDSLPATEYRMEQANTSYNRLKPILHSTHLTTHQKLHLYQSVVVSTLLYGMEAHFINVSSMKKWSLFKTSTYGPFSNARHSCTTIQTQKSEK